MYQLDIPEKALIAALDVVVEDAVSLVGVDLNVRVYIVRMCAYASMIALKRTVFVQRSLLFWFSCREYMGAELPRHIACPCSRNDERHSKSGFRVAKGYATLF